MARTTDRLAKRPRICIDVNSELHRRLRLAAARRDITVGQYVLDAIDARLRDDAPADDWAPVALTAASDPILAELWDNEHDAVYDRL